MDGLLLFLFLDLVSSICFSLFRVRSFLQFSLFNSQFIIFLGDLCFCKNSCLIGSLICSSLGNGNITFCLRLCNGSVLADLRSIIHTKILDQAMFICYILDIAGKDLNSQLLHILRSLCHNLI